MNLLVFGASGATGRHVVHLALARGWRVTGFVRHVDVLPRQTDFNQVQGDVADAEAVAGAIPGHDAVISALGVGIPLQHDPKVIAGIQHIIASMEQSGVRRLIYLSSIAVRATHGAGGPILSLAARFPLRREHEDHERKEALVQASLLDWTIVRAPKLTNGRPRGVYQSGEDLRARSLLPRISRADAADFMLTELMQRSFVHKAVHLI